MTDDELKYLASAMLLAQAIGNFSRVASPSDVEHAVTNAEKSREEINKHHRQSCWDNRDSDFGKP